MSDEVFTGALPDPVGAGDGRGVADPGAGVGGVNGTSLWQGYARDSALDLAGNLEQAARAFRAKFGYPALETKWAGAVILAGPVGVIPVPVPGSRTARAAAAHRGAVELSPVEAAQRALQLALELGEV